ncbi:DUF2306 domain-containing protein [Asticcacaulis solisilvae]|uniref:DUF2306 domain-containing protein n=1 Tax=Asticcacaulis solisilvae TaxID=1217274 RepID=UPI003FD72D90
MANPAQSSAAPGTTLLRRAGLVWYLTAAVGQLAFVWMILAHYGRKTIQGNYAGWNDKPILKGYVAGDLAGNIMFGMHVLLAAYITLGGLIQLIPAIRARVPAFHRWNGRIFLVIAYLMALGGLWLVWIRPTYVFVISGVAITLEAALIIVFATIAWRLAATRRLDAHRPWAMRTFMVVNGVWFLRIFIMAWVLLAHGAGMNNTLSSPVDIALQFAAFLLPLAVLETYLLAQRSHSAIVRRAVASLVLILTGLMAVGTFGAVAFMWGPYMKL